MTLEVEGSSPFEHPIFWKYMRSFLFWRKNSRREWRVFAIAKIKLRWVRAILTDVRPERRRAPFTTPFFEKIGIIYKTFDVMWPLIILFIWGSILTVGDIVMKKWVESNQFTTFLLGLWIYVIGLICMAYTFKFKNIAVASMIFIIFNIVTLLIVSTLYFQEKLSLYQLIGIALGILSVCFLELG